MTKEDFIRAGIIVDKIQGLKIDREKLQQGLRVISEAVDLEKYVDIPALRTKIKTKITKKIDDLKAEFTAL